jgi:hypothetical protein
MRRPRIQPSVNGIEALASWDAHAVLPCFLDGIEHGTEPFVDRGFLPSCELRDESLLRLAEEQRSTAMQVGEKPTESSGSVN